MLQSSSGFIIPKTIIYVATKNMAWKVYSTLHREAAKRCYVSVYHADLTSHTKSLLYFSSLNKIFIGTTSDLTTG